MTMELKERIAKLEAELNELKEELDKKEYCLNVFTEMPKENKEYLILGTRGNIFSLDWNGNDEKEYEWCEDFFENTILFKDKRSAETYKELRQDMKRLSKEFEYNKRNYFLYYNHGYKEVYVDYFDGCEKNDYYFTQENAQYILDKYGQEVLKNYILYCK